MFWCGMPTSTYGAPNVTYPEPGVEADRGVARVQGDLAEPSRRRPPAPAPGPAACRARCPAAPARPPSGTTARSPGPSGWNRTQPTTRPPVERDQVQALGLEREGHRVAPVPERLPEHPPPQISLLRVLRRVEADEGQPLAAQMSSSSPSTSRARSMMNLKRAETSLPIRSLIIRSVSSSFSMPTRSELRRLRVERRRLEVLGRHLAQALEAHDVGLGVPFELLLEDPVAVGLVERPVGLLADVDPVQRRLGEVDVPVLDQRPAGAGRRTSAAASRCGGRRCRRPSAGRPCRSGACSRSKLVADAAAERADDVLQLLVAGHLVGGRLLGVEHLAAQREDGLGAPVAPLLGRAAGRVALDDEQLALARGRSTRSRPACPGRLSRWLTARLARHRLRRRAAGLAGPGRQDDAGRRSASATVWLSLSHFSSAGRTAPSTRPAISGLFSRLLGLALELRLEHVGREDGDHALADVLGGERHALGRRARASRCSCGPP